MISLRGVQTLDGGIADVQLPSSHAHAIDAHGLTLLPALVDPHVHFRTPGFEHKENWESGARAALYGGITTVFDMPNTWPSTITMQALQEKKMRIDEQLKNTRIPLHYGLYLGADKNHFDEIARCKDSIVGIKLFMGASTGGCVMDDASSLHALFSLAASLDLLLAIHAEDEALIQERKKLFAPTHPRVHSQVRNADVALRATQTAIALARLYKTRIYLLHISTKQEVDAIRQAKDEGLSVYAETTPHHLFLTEGAYETHGTRVQTNPPLRSFEHVDALWNAIHEGVIDTIGSDHAPHTLAEKREPYDKSPSGMPGVETTLPLLLNVCNEGKISLHAIVTLMRDNVFKIFRTSPTQDYILVDMHKTKKVEDAHLKTKVHWSPYAGCSLKGWPVVAILGGCVYELD